MASGLSNYLENKLIDHVFKQTPYTAPATLYVALFTVSPGDSDTGTEVSTVGTGYARAAIAASSSANWSTTQGTNTAPSTGTSGSTSNLIDINFAAPTANWGDLVAFGIYDAASGGNLLYYATFPSKITVNLGSAAKKFAAGNLVITYN